MAINPMAFVTPYTAVGASRIGAGQGFANVINNARNTKVQEGYLANTQRRQSVDEQRYNNQEVDKAHQALLSAIASGDQDAVEAAANNLRAVGSRYGVTIDEVRSDRAQANVAGQTSTANEALREAAPEGGKYGLGTEEAPFDVDAYDAAQAQASGKQTPDQEAASNARIDAELAADAKAQAFTGGIRTPGGSLPAQVGGPAEPGPRPPGGVLPRAASAAEPPGASEAPLRGYTVRGPDGKELYKVSPEDVVNGQRARVGAVFDGLPADVADAGAVAEAKKIATGLVGVLTPQQAVQKGLEHLQQGQQRRGALQITEANRKPRWGTGGGAAPTDGWATGKTGAAMNQFGDDIYKAITTFSSTGKLPALNAADQAIRVAEQGLQAAGNPAEQRFAVQQLIKAMSGLTVSVAEDNRYQRLAGVLPQMENLLAQFTGERMSPEYIRRVLGVVQQWRASSAQVRAEIASEAAETFSTVAAGRAPDDVVADGASAVYNALITGSGMPRRTQARKIAPRPLEGQGGPTDADVGDL